MRILLALLLLGLAACDADRPVHTDFDPGADFGQYRTYRVSDPGSGPGSTTAAPNPRVVEAITSTLREELGAKGMREDPEADLEVALTIATAEETAVDQWGYQWRAEGGGPVDDEYRV